MHSQHLEQNTEGSPSASAPEDPIAAARELLAQEEQARLHAFREELGALCAKYGVDLNAQIVLNARQP